ncbi:hypothetical protein [Sphaerotilus sp.]|uniref:hypothetical protein n=1 Tax=Sphaerotilus sp. TaxID=2093942 RepID=UPI00286DAF35|nr:hypothetical protein [Sphaerotilus sp.]
MLRALVLILMLANAAFYGWTQGWLTDVLGLSPDGNREPQRLTAQIDPTALRVLSLGATARPGSPSAALPATATQIPAPEASEPPASTPASASTGNPEDRTAAPAAPPPPICLEAGPFTPAEWRVAENALRNTLGEGPWQLTTREKPGSWIVYVGPYKSRTVMDKRAEQLRKMEIAFEEARDLPEEYLPGFVFGRHGVEADARALQTRLTTQKVKYVRVVPLVKPTALHTVRIQKADADIHERVTALKPRLSGHPFETCKR